MSFQGVDILRANGGLGRKNPSKDSVAGMVLGAVAVAGTFVLGTVHKLLTIEDAENLGLNESYDTNNNILVHHHISEFFRLAPEGTLYIMGVAQTVTQSQSCDVANAYLLQLIKSETL